MFGFGRKKRSLHLLYLQTVAASHSMRVSFQEIWNNNCIHASINPLTRGDQDLIYIFDIYNRWMNSLFNERRGFGGDPIAQTLPVLIYFASMKDAYLLDDAVNFEFTIDQSEKDFFLNFDFTTYTPTGKKLLSDYTSFQKSYQPFLAFGEEVVAYTRYFASCMKKLPDNDDTERFINNVISEFKKIHIKLWKEGIDWQEDYTLNNETHDCFSMLKNSLTN